MQTLGLHFPAAMMTPLPSPSLEPGFVLPSSSSLSTLFSSQKCTASNYFQEHVVFGKYQEYLSLHIAQQNGFLSFFQLEFISTTKHASRYRNFHRDNTYMIVLEARGVQL